ncbi:MAG TPA: cellulose biosynthesis cyclic di-GMP-binding regulatory protein BcsB [Candidatus Acidoferrales bacterium]|jgi:hypothetical protein|nr:cellulose biosynthesis cyclic di-GMP-binding regulatory protein BcsB [Candidatus Acidoferrales bacterium]
MRRFSGRRLTLTAALTLLVLVLPLARGARAADANVTLGLPIFGFASGATVTGTNPRFDLYVPDYRSARSMRVHFTLQFPEHVDGDATVVVRADGAQIGSATVASLRKGGSLDGTFNKFHGTGRMIDVSVETYLTVKTSSTCKEFDPRSLWMRVAPQSRIEIAHATTPAATVAEFFQDYDGRYAVDVASGAPDETHLAAIALGYWINQIERWRRVHLTFEEKAAGAPRNIVVESEAAQDLALRDGTLYVTQRGIDLIAAKGAPTIVAPWTSGVAVRHGPAPASPASLDALGIGTRTQRGSGDLSFPIDFTLGTFGGLPETLHLHLQLSHGPYRSGDRAAVSIWLNGAVVNGFNLSQQGKTEDFDVPLDVNRLAGSNQLAVVVEFIPKSEACAGGRPAMAASVLGTSTFTWTSLANFSPSIGEFFNEVSDNVGVAVGPNLDGAAFTLMTRFGTVNPNVTSLKVLRYTGTPIDGYRSEIYVADAASLAELPLAYDPATGALKVTSDAGKTVYQASLDFPAGIVQTVREATPTLVLTYAKSPSALDAMRVVSFRELSNARYDVLVFNDRGIAYTNPPQIVADRRRPPTPIRSSWPLIAAFGALIVIALVFIARRARKVS